MESACLATALSGVQTASSSGTSSAWRMMEMQMTKSRKVVPQRGCSRLMSRASHAATGPPLSKA